MYIYIYTYIHDVYTTCVCMISIDFGVFYMLPIRPRHEDGKRLVRASVK